ncbi:hypothetical protein JS530_07420 [Bifidobacterium sp. LC6]|uniref:VapC50 C-terminal domain-containing protein n=1 Tax=Bifidobacterium colobi TaxID=2809026 RepID=A0ABS5UW20_9BIFI|nr:hypothetical protein [Bifidobacterium colobi]MBT1175329.1 hypothetical protein [Bifidobacterium colobi]
MDWTTGEVVLPAAAYNGDVDVIVTFNLKDFPANQLAKIGLSARHPDAFLTNVAEAYPERTIKAMNELVLSKKHPPRTMQEELERLENSGLARFARMMRKLMCN